MENLIDYSTYSFEQLTEAEQKINKNEENFFKNKSSKDGLQSCCKECRRKYVNEHRKKNVEKTRKENREYYQQHKKERIASVKKWQQKVKNDPYRKFKNRIKSSIRRHKKKWRKNL